MRVKVHCENVRILEDPYNLKGTKSAVSKETSFLSWGSFLVKINGHIRFSDSATDQIRKWDDHEWENTKSSLILEHRNEKKKKKTSIYMGKRRRRPTSPEVTSGARNTIDLNKNTCKETSRETKNEWFRPFCH